jgi:hypothetical protein
MENLQPNVTFVEHPIDLSRPTEYPLSNLTDSISPSERTTVEYEGATAFNTTLPRLLDTDTAIYIYFALILGSVFITSIRSIFFFKVCMTASKILHDTMFRCILAATMRFFDTNPSGKSIRIMYFLIVHIGCVVVFIWFTLQIDVSIYIISIKAFHALFFSPDICRII